MFEPNPERPYLVRLVENLSGGGKFLPRSRERPYLAAEEAGWGWEGGKARKKHVGGVVFWECEPAVRLTRGEVPQAVWC